MPLADLEISLSLPLLLPPTPPLSLSLSVSLPPSLSTSLPLSPPPFSFSLSLPPLSPPLSLPPHPLSPPPDPPPSAHLWGQPVTWWCCWAAVPAPQCQWRWRDIFWQWHLPSALRHWSPGHCHTQGWITHSATILLHSSDPHTRLQPLPRVILKSVCIPLTHTEQGTTTAMLNIELHRQHVSEKLPSCLMLYSTLVQPQPHLILNCTDCISSRNCRHI